MGGGSSLGQGYSGGYSGGTPAAGTQNFWSGGAPLNGYSGGTQLRTDDPYGQVPLPQQPNPSDINDFFNRFFNFSGGAQPSLSGLGTKLQ